MAKTSTPVSVGGQSRPGSPGGVLVTPSGEAVGSTTPAVYRGGGGGKTIVQDIEAEKKRMAKQFEQAQSTRVKEIKTARAETLSKTKSDYLKERLRATTPQERLKLKQKYVQEAQLQEQRFDIKIRQAKQSKDLQELRKEVEPVASTTQAVSQGRLPTKKDTAGVLISEYTPKSPTTTPARKLTVDEKKKVVEDVATMVVEEKNKLAGKAFKNLLEFKRDLITNIEKGQKVVSTAAGVTTGFIAEKVIESKRKKPLFFVTEKVADAGIKVGGAEAVGKVSDTGVLTTRFQPMSKVSTDRFASELKTGDKPSSQILIKGAKKTGETAGFIAPYLVPGLGVGLGAKDIGKGVRDKDPWSIAAGVGIVGGPVVGRLIKSAKTPSYIKIAESPGQAAKVRGVAVQSGERLQGFVVKQQKTPQVVYLKTTKFREGLGKVTGKVKGQQVVKGGENIVTVTGFASKGDSTIAKTLTTKVSQKPKTIVRVVGSEAKKTSVQAISRGTKAERYIGELFRKPQFVVGDEQLFQVLTRSRPVTRTGKLRTTTTEAGFVSVKKGGLQPVKRMDIYEVGGVGKQFRGQSPKAKGTREKFAGKIVVIQKTGGEGVTGTTIVGTKAMKTQQSQVQKQIAEVVGLSQKSPKPQVPRTKVKSEVKVTTQSVEDLPLMVGGLGRGKSAFEGRGMVVTEEVTGPMTLTAPTGKSTLVTDIRQRQFATEISPTKAATIQVERTQEELKPVLITPTAQTQESVPKFDVASRGRIGLRTTQVSGTDQRVKLRTSGSVPKSTTPSVKPPKVPNFKVPPTTIDTTPSPTLKSGLKKFREAFDVFVKRKGEFQKVAGGLPRGLALKKGAEITSKTLAATFRIEKGKGVAKSQDIKFTPSPGLFRTFKISGGRRVELKDTFIQRRGTRLGTTGERKEIQMFKKTKKSRGLL